MLCLCRLRAEFLLEYYVINMKFYFIGRREDWDGGLAAGTD